MTGPGNGSAPAGEARGAMRTGLAAGQRPQPNTDFVQTPLLAARLLHAQRDSE